MYVRLAFAVAAHLEPEILLVDEVLAVGDVGFQKKCLGKIGDVARQGRTVLFVSHNMGAISNLCRRAMLLDAGRIAESGPTDAVVHAYVSRATAAVPDHGFADVRGRPRRDARGGRARYDWVRTLRDDGASTGTFLEGEPITVEVGITLLEPIRHLQLGCEVASAEVQGALFTIPSPDWSGAYPAGMYTSRLRLEPSHVRAGTFSLTLRMFADGSQPDAVKDALHLSIVGRLSADDEPAYSLPWVHGPLRLPYRWGPVEPREWNDPPGVSAGADPGAGRAAEVPGR
jgi:lipopolysaccharide transport system ATP-binding protein